MRVGVVALVLVVALSTLARAGNRDVGIVVQGQGSLKSKVEDQLAKQLRAEGFTAVESPLSQSALDTLSNCFIIEDLTCAKGVVEARAKTAMLVFARIDDSTGATTLDLTWFSAGHAPLQERTSCASCSATAQDHTTDLVKKLAGRVESPVITQAPAEAPVAKKHSKLIPGLLIGGGIATLVTGSALLYYGLRDGASHKYVYPQLTPVGITLIAVGGGAMVGGIITW
jgi:hypothetical protein